MSGMPIALAEDNPPYLAFRHDVVEDRSKTKENGRFSYKDVSIVTLTPHGDNKTEVEHEVDAWLEHLKDRHRAGQISENYYNYCTRAYQNWKDKGEVPLNGTPILGWPVASPAMQKTIIDANIRTVEDLANAPEDAITAIGMGARALKDKAKAWLKSAEDHGKVAEEMDSLKAALQAAEEREQKRDKEIAELRAELEKQGKKKGK